MLPNFDVTSLILAVAAVILGVALGIAAAGWFVGWIFPRLRLGAPFAIAAFACWRAALSFPRGDQRPYFVVPFILSGAAVAVHRALRGSPGRAPGKPPPGAGPPSPAPATSGSSPRSSGRTAVHGLAGAAARILFIGSAAIYGALHMDPRHLATGVLGIVAALLVTWTWNLERSSPATPHPRRSSAAKAAMGLALLALGAAALPDPPVLEGLPAELASLHARLAVRIAATVALAAGAALLLAWEARRARNVFLVEAIVVTLSLAGVAFRVLSPRSEALSRLGRIAVTSITFDPPAGWAEVVGPPAPMRLYERNDGEESVLVAPMLYLRSLDRWCDERGVAVARTLASAMFESATLRVHEEAYYPCSFQVDLESRTARRTARFGLGHCNDERQLAFLHAWSDAWEAARGAVAVGPPQGPGARRSEIEQLIRCR